MKGMTLDNIYLYRMTHIDNIPHILNYGITHKNSVNANPNYVQIGDESLIDLRSVRTVNVINGEKIVLGDYIPFYFGVRMPMLYVVQHGGNFVSKAFRSDSIVYIAVKLQSIVSAYYTYYFSDGHGTDKLTIFYDSSKIESLPEIIDWNAVTAKQWSGDNIENDIRRRKQAEFLVKQDIEQNLLFGFVCSCEATKGILVSMGVKSDIVKIFPNAYYL